MVGGRLLCDIYKDVKPERSHEVRVNLEIDSQRIRYHITGKGALDRRLCSTVYAIHSGRLISI